VNRLRLALAFGGLVLIGVGAGATGVLIPYQITDYHIDKVIIGLSFLAFSGGYVLSGIANGPLIHRLGSRGQLTLGAASYLTSALVIGVHPPFAAFVALTLALGFGAGVLDAGLNAYVTTLPGHTGLLNYLHGFFGIGALLGPLLAAALVHRHVPWQDTYLVLAALSVPLLVGFALAYPRAEPVAEDDQARTPLTRALRHPAVWLAATFLCLYVGIEAAVGNWSFSLLTELKGEGDLIAGYAVSGYWLGLTIGRFLINALASRAGFTLVATMYGCLAGVIVAVALTWWGPTGLVTALGFALVGFFLGPIFPSTIAVTPTLLPARLVSSAIGLLVGASVVGGTVFPWLAGALAQGFGLTSLLPYLLALAVAQAIGWWAIARRMSAAEPAAEPAPVSAL
jgi:fucose permease